MDEAYYHQWVTSDGQPWLFFYRQKAGYLLHIPETCVFLLDDSCSKLYCIPEDGIGLEIVRNHFLDDIMPLVVSAHEAVVLHASSVTVNGEAYAFAGESGVGKSTFAAAMASNGAELLSDDYLRVSSGVEGFSVYPSYSSVRLCQDAAVALGQTAGPIPENRDQLVKSRHQFPNQNKECETRQLGGVFLLSPQEKVSRIELDPVPTQEAFIELLQNSFILDVCDRKMLRAQFETLLRVVEVVPVRRLRYTQQLSGIRELSTDIEALLAKDLTTDNLVCSKNIPQLHCRI